VGDDNRQNLIGAKMIGGEGMFNFQWGGLIS
jgi:hypothetical protein